MRERISKSCGRKRRALPPQCADVPPTMPLSTTTTSTGFSFAVDISVVPVALDGDVLRKAFRIDRHLAGLDVEHADGFGVVRLAAGDQVAVFAGGQSGEAEKLPPHLV